MRYAKRQTEQPSPYDEQLHSVHFARYVSKRNQIIVAAHLGGVSLRRISRDVGLSPAQVCRIIAHYRNGEWERIDPAMTIY